MLIRLMNMPKEKFANESTYKNYIENGKEDEFDGLFENAANNKLGFEKQYPMYINGKEIYSSDLIVEKSPIDSTVIGSFQRGTKEHAQQAVKAAMAAFKFWSLMDYKKRAYILKSAANLLSEPARKFELAAILSYENGKSRYESVGEVDEAIDFMRYYSSEFEANKGYTRRTKIEGSQKEVKSGFQGAPSSGEKITIAMKPYGVFGVIAPFNFPVSISIGMSSAALITGNTVVFKPSSTDNMTMLTGLKIYELFRDAGVPAGVFNYVTGLGTVIGSELITNPDVSGIAFTGSRSIGMSMVAKSLGMGMQKVFIVEMGGKNPAIISKYADIEKAVSGVASAAFGFSGQKCSALSRLYVHESIKEEFISRLISKVRDLKIGNPLQKDVYIGPLISRSAYDRYIAVMEKARASSRILYGGNTVKTGFLNSYYVEPVIIDAKHDSDIVHMELFLPILTVESFTNLDEAIRLANDTEYGLTAGFYSKKNGEIKKFIDNIEAGVVYVNREVSATTGAIVGVHAFVGWKGSALTGKGTGSKFYLQQFMHEQSISVSE